MVIGAGQSRAYLRPCLHASKQENKLMAAIPVPAGSIIVTPGGPNNDLPGLPPTIWPSPGHPSHPIVLPPPPPGIWPPPVSIWPPQPLPPGHPMPPGSIWPPVIGGGPVYPPPRPDQGLPPVQGHPDQGLPGDQPHPDQGLPGDQPRPDQGLPGAPVYPGHGLPSQKFLVAIVAVSAGGGLEVVGYTVVDPSLSPGYPLPPPPTAQPK